MTAVLTPVSLPGTGCALWHAFGVIVYFFLASNSEIFGCYKQGMEVSRDEWDFLDICNWFYFVMCQRFGAPGQNKYRLKFQASFSLADPSEICLRCPKFNSQFSQCSPKWIILHIQSLYYYTQHCWNNHHNLSHVVFLVLVHSLTSMTSIYLSIYLSVGRSVVCLSLYDIMSLFILIFRGDGKLILVVYSKATGSNPGSSGWKVTL